MAKKNQNQNAVYAKKYTSFLGVDFSKDASMVDDRRSPDAQNVISDLDGLPEKRVGWRVLENFEGRINGIFSFVTEEARCTIVHAGDKIFKLRDGEREELYSGCADNISCGKLFKGKLYILTGSEYLVFDGEKCVRAEEYDEMYAPITQINGARIPICEDGDIINEYHNSDFRKWIKEGVLPDVNNPIIPDEVELNLISGRRRNTFESTGHYNAFILDSKIDPGSRVVMKNISTGEVIFDIVFSDKEQLQDDYYSVYENVEDENLYTSYEGALVKIEGYINKDAMLPIEEKIYSVEYLYIGNSERNNCGFVACRPRSVKSASDGIDEISVEYTHKIDGYTERIDKCRFMDVFENRVFFSGNPDYPNVEWASGVNDPLFVPDINYTEIGLDSSRIMGYLRVGAEQAIIKSDGDGSTTYMRSYQSLSDGEVIFPIKQGISGLGAISSRAMTTFLDDPVYLTRNGVYAIAQQDISSERALCMRSTRVNGKLLFEKNLENAVMCEWDGYLILCVNGKCFVADASKKSYSGNKTSTFEYEWYFWTNIPARVLCESKGTLFFGTDDGRLCCFNSDMKNERGEILSSAYTDNGNAICAIWSTPLSDDGDFTCLKTMLKKGSGVFLKSYNRSGVSVAIKTDSEDVGEITEKNAGIFNFEDLDFENFTFNTSSYTVVPFNRKVKKYKAIQIVCKNDKPNHAFGIGGIIRKYFYAKTDK